MLGHLILFIIAVVIAVLPVMFAARLVGAGRTGFGWSLLAIIFQGIAWSLVQAFVATPIVALIVAVVVGSAVYAFILDTSWLKGLLIGIIAMIIGVVVFVVLASFFLAAGSVI